MPLILDAVKFIIDELSPALMKDHPEAKMYIAGAGWDGRKDLGNIHFLGFVPDIQLWISDCRTYASHQCGRELAF